MTACVRWMVGITLATLASELSAQTVQLPTFRQFGVSTSVVVPDRGTATLGGMSRAYEDGYELGSGGPGPLERARRRRHEVSSGSVRAWVHDFERWDSDTRTALGERSDAPATQQRAAAISRRWRELHEQRRREAGTFRHSAAH